MSHIAWELMLMVVYIQPSSLCYYGYKALSFLGVRTHDFEFAVGIKNFSLLNLLLCYNVKLI